MVFDFQNERRTFKKRFVLLLTIRRCKMAKVIVYSTKTCPWCKKTKEFLKANKVSFTTKDVGSSKKNAQEMFKKSGQQGVPVTDVNGTIITGFNEGKLKKALKL